MIVYSEIDNSGYKGGVITASQHIHDKSSVVKASALSRENKQFLKQIGFKLKVKKRYVKNQK